MTDALHLPERSPDGPNAQNANVHALERWAELLKAEITSLQTAVANYAGTGDIANIAATEAAGSATTIPRGDHVHAHPDLSAAVLGHAKVVRKTADETVTSSTTLQDDDELLFAVAANEIWVGTVVLFYSADGTVGAGDISVLLTAPAGASVRFGGAGPYTTIGAGASNADGQFLGNVSNAIDFGGSGSPTPVLVATVHFSVANSSTAGNVTVQWAQRATSATATTVKTGSYLVTWRKA